LSILSIRILFSDAHTFLAQCRVLLYEKKFNSEWPPRANHSFNSELIHSIWRVLANKDTKEARWKCQ
jgi:hypothetical protein